MRAEDKKTKGRKKRKDDEGVQYKIERKKKREKEKIRKEVMIINFKSNVFFSFLFFFEKSGERKKEKSSW